MPRQTPIERYRNIGISAHIDAGKTTTTERILFYTGVNHKIGEVHDGAATMDWMEQEQERGITITSAATHCMWRGMALHARAGWRLHGLRLGGRRAAAVGNRLAPGQQIQGAAHRMRERLKGNPVPIQIPVGAEDGFRGVVDLVKMKEILWDDASQGVKFEYTDIDPALLPIAQEWREKMVEAAAEADEELLNKYLGGEELTEEEIKRALRKRTIAGEIQPMLCGSAFKNKGVQAMLDAVVDYLPSPVDIPAIEGHGEKDEPLERHPSDSEPFAALAFKIMTDPFVGQLAFFRVYSGKINSGDTVYNSVKQKKERLGRILQMHANQREEIKEVLAGDIAAAVGLKDVTTGETLCDPEHVIVLERMEFPEPVISQAVEPKTKADQEKMGIALNRLAQEDPSFRVKTDEESGQTIISGMGELHLEILVDRMKREFGVEATVGKPQVAYRETIKKAAEDVEGKFVKQSGGRGQYGHAVITLEPNDGKGYEFVDEIKGGVIPREFIPAVDKGIRDTLNTGVLAGYPVVDVKVRLTFGSYHDVDSNENAFRMAGSMAFKEAMRKAGPILLEPMMAVEVETPEDYMGNVIGDLSSRRGIVQGTEDIPGGGGKVVHAEVPLAEMFGYSTNLRSLSQGRATYTMEFKHYAEAPRNVSEAVMAAKKV
ncbi:hypothetical protein DL763_009775 [Monosporascus cannonballus]|nr:hypothetical protein DL763_009775 [Monosporascus cannonballus]